MKKFIIYTLFACAAMLVAPLSAHAGLGVSPSSINVDTLKRGTTFTQEFVISRSDPVEDLEALIQPDLGDLAQWVSFEPGLKVLLPKGEQRVSLKAIISVPADANLQDYEGVFRILASPKNAPTGVAVVQGARVDLKLATTETSTFDLEIRTVTILDSYEQEELVMTMNVQNNGNTASAPTKIDLEVQDMQENNVKDLTTTDIDQAPAYEFSNVNARFGPHGLVAGEYFGVVQVYSAEEMISEERVVFEIFPAKVYETVCTGASESMAESADMYFYIATAAGVLFAGLALYLVLKNKEDEKKLIKSLLVALGFLVFVAAAYVVFMQDALGIFTRECVEQLVEDEDAVVEEEEVVEEEATTDEATDEASDVQGAETENVPVTVVSEGNVGSLRVGVAPTDGKYRVYELNDLTSEVVYLAEEGENLTVLEESGSWYKVKTADGTEGWLPKDNLKQE